MAGQKAIMTPITIGGVKVKNRVLMPPMSTNYGNHDGTVSPKLHNHYLERARGGAGLIVVEAASVSAPAGRIANNQLIINDVTKLTGYRSMTDAIHAFDAKVLLQIQHAGFKAKTACSGGLQSVTSSEVPGEDARAATIDEIRLIEQQFIDAAVNAKNAGFDGIELHAAHSYLLDEFLSPHINRRTDEYGGTPENRFRILKNILIGIREKCPRPFILGLRLGLVDNFPDGLAMEDGIQIAKWCEEYGADLLNLSAGFGEASVATQWDPSGSRLYLTEIVKKEVSIPVAAIGKFRGAAMCSQYIEEGKLDMVAIGRQLICDPHWPNKVLTGREDTIRPCLNCNEGCIYQFDAFNAEVRCVLNPYVGHDEYYNEHNPAQVAVPKKIAVVGGGVAGMQFAITAKKRGHNVVIYEKSGQLGGQLHLAAKPPFKEEIRQAAQWFSGEVERLQIPVVFNKEATIKDFQGKAFDCVVLACGSEPNRVPIPGIEYAVDFRSVLDESVTVPQNEKVAVIGGGQVGCELAHLLCENGCEVTIIEMIQEICKGMEPAHKKRLTSYLMENAEIALGASVSKIDQKGVCYTDNTGSEVFYEADTVVYSTGQCTLGNTLYDELVSAGIMAYKIGECRQTPGNIRLATRGAQEVAMAL